MRRFLKWTILFGAVGVLIPLLLLVRYYLFGTGFGRLETTIWPSSFMFMALDAPGTPIPTVVFIYALAFAENFLLYALFAVATWPVAYLIRRRRDQRLGSRIGM